MAKGLKIPIKKVKEVKKRLLTKTLTEDDYKVLKDMLDESIEIGLVRIVPPKDND
jgi:hypothetical protein